MQCIFPHDPNMIPNFVAGMGNSCLFFFLSMVYVVARCSPNVFNMSAAFSSSQLLVFSFVISSIFSSTKIDCGLFTDFGNKRMYSDILKI